MAATNKKTEGVATPTARIAKLCACDCPRHRRAVQAAGTGTMETYIGSALRHGRAALGRVRARGPGDARAASELRKGREAFNRALWLAEYCEADQ